jgi:hypothetical protein
MKPSHAMKRAAEVLRKYAGEIEESEIHRSGPLKGRCEPTIEAELAEYRQLAAALEAPEDSNFAQALSVIHDELHKGNVGEAHSVAHRALGIEDGLIDQLGRKFYRDFDIAFNTACRKTNVVAGYVIFDHDNPDQPRQVRILMGGNVYALQLLKPIVAAGQHVVAAPMASPSREPAPRG